MKKRIITKGSYILLSVSIAALIICTALPYYLLTSISFPGFSIFWSYEHVQRRMLWLFPVLALFGAITTLKKKVTFEDLFINCIQGLTILLGLKAAQYYMPVVTITIAALLVFVSLIIKSVWHNSLYKNTNTFKKIRISYYKSRRVAAYLLLLVFTPLGIMVGFKENGRQSRLNLLYYSLYAEETDSTDIDSLQLNIVTTETWENLSTESRFNELEKAASYFLTERGVNNGTNLYAVKELTDGTLAYYNDRENSISFNVSYLSECTLEEALEVTAHECYHKYEHELIRSIQTLEELGFNCCSMPFYIEAVELEKADNSYGLDSLTWEGYSTNKLETDANKYAAMMLDHLKTLGILDDVQ